MSSYYDSVSEEPTYELAESIIRAYVHMLKKDVDYLNEYPSAAGYVDYSLEDLSYVHASRFSTNEHDTTTNAINTTTATNTTSAATDDSAVVDSPAEESNPQLPSQQPQPTAPQPPATPVDALLQLRRAQADVWALMASLKLIRECRALLQLLVGGDAKFHSIFANSNNSGNSMSYSSSNYSVNANINSAQVFSKTS